MSELEGILHVNLSLLLEIKTSYMKWCSFSWGWCNWPYGTRIKLLMPYCIHGYKKLRVVTAHWLASVSGELLLLLLDKRKVRSL